MATQGNKKCANEKTMKHQSAFYQTVILPSKTLQEKQKIPLKQLKNTLTSYEKQPLLKKPDTEKYRNSLQRQLSIEMLVQGYHHSFRELCAILERQKKDRERLGSEHSHYRRPLLDAEKDKLRFLCTYLNKAEDAERRKQYLYVYKNNIELATFFVKTDDYWLSDYFYKKCLSTVQAYPQLDSQLVAEAYRNVGLVYERQGKFSKALKNYEIYRQSSEHYYELKTDANLQLTRFYIKLSEHKKDNEALEYILRAYDTSKQSDDKKLEHETCYKLGRTYLEHDNIDLALKYFHIYYDYCQHEKDYEGFGFASEALSICYQKKEMVDKVSEYLTRYLQTVSHKQDDDQYERACSTYALIETTLGNYDSAIESSSKAYSISLANRNCDLNRNRVLHGIVNGLKLRSIFIDNINHMKLRSLMEWKSTRLERYLKNDRSFYLCFSFSHVIYFYFIFKRLKKINHCFES